MNCDCIEQFQTKLREHTGDTKAGLSSGFVMVNREIDGKTQLGMEFVLMMTAFYRDKKKDGSLKEKSTPHYNIIVKFCPFCGKKLMGETNQSEALK